MSTLTASRRLGWYWVGVSMVVFFTGCQSDFNGQTLPSAWWQADDVQYFAPGPEFKLAREAAAMEAYKRDAAGQAPIAGGMPPAPIASPAPLGTPMGEPIPVPGEPNL